MERYGLGVSSATVRHILADLEMAGLLTHPHTSAGRMPTDAGYRFYVESLADVVPLPSVEQLIGRHQFGQVEFASEHWFRLAATTLAGLTRAAGLATPAKPRSAHIRRVDLVAVNERMASLILVLREGAIKQSAVGLDEADAVDQGTLNRVAGLLNDRLAERTASQAEDVLATLTADETHRACRPARRRADRPDPARLRCGRRRGGLQRWPAQRDGGPGVRPERQAPAGLHGLREPGVSGRAGRQVSGGGRMHGLHRRRERSEEMSEVLAHRSPRTVAAIGRIGVVGVMGPPAWATRMPSARCATCAA